MNIRPHHHLESTWLNQGLPGAGALAECEIETACLSKRAVRIEPVHAEAMDECADWAGRQRPVCVGTCETSAGCSCVADVPPAPAEACSHLLADPESAPFFFPLEPILTRHQWLGPTLVALVCFVWLCIDGYLENLP